MYFHFMRDFNRSPRGNNRFGNRSFNRRSAGANNDRPQMFKAVCSDCGKDCEVPFRPTGNKEIYCRDCFNLRGGNKREFAPQSYENRSRNEDNYMGNHLDSYESNFNKLREKRSTPPARPSGRDYGAEINELKNLIGSFDEKLEKIIKALKIKPEKIKTVKVTKEKLAKVIAEKKKD